MLPTDCIFTYPTNTFLRQYHREINFSHAKEYCIYSSKMYVPCTCCNRSCLSRLYESFYLTGALVDIKDMISCKLTSSRINFHINSHTCALFRLALLFSRLILLGLQRHTRPRSWPCLYSYVHVYTYPSRFSLMAKSVQKTG